MGQTLPVRGLVSTMTTPHCALAASFACPVLGTHVYTLLITTYSYYMSVLLRMQSTIIQVHVQLKCEKWEKSSICYTASYLIQLGAFRVIKQSSLLLLCLALCSLTRASPLEQPIKRDWSLQCLSMFSLHGWATNYLNKNLPQGYQLLGYYSGDVWTP